MATILPHTNRPTGTVVTEAVYNDDHNVHITNANALNDAVIERVFTFEAKTMASGQTVPSDVHTVRTYQYSHLVDNHRGGARYIETDAAGVSGVNSRFWFQDLGGRYFIIDTKDQKITMSMIGAIGDLTYELQSGLNNGGGDGNGTTTNEGFIKTGGTDDRAVMLLLDAFATANGIPAYIDADHYIRSQIKLTAAWYGIKGEYTFENTLWFEYFSPYDGTVDTIMDEIEVGCWFENPGDHSGLYDLKIIGQFNQPTSLPTKPSVCVPDMPILGPGGGLGHKGCIVLVGEQYYPDQPQAPIMNCNLRIMIMRAGHKSSTGHYSRNNAMIAIAGYTEHCKFEIGLFGKTNTTSAWVILLLWGLWFDPDINGFAPYKNFIPNVTQSTILEQYFPSYHDLSFLTDIDNTVTFANIGKTYELNACGPCVVHGYYAKGVPCGAGAVTCGDYTDTLSCPRQNGIANRGHHIGFIKADKCYQQEASSELHKGGFLIKGGGTCSGRTLLYDDTESNVCTPDPSTLNPDQPQQPWAGGNKGIQKFTTQIFDVECDGFDMEILNSAHQPVDADGLTGLLVLNGRGHFNLGHVTLRGDCHRGIEIEHFNGDFEIESYQGVGALSHEFSKGGRFSNINNDRGTAVEIAFTSGGTHVAAVGETITGLTSAATGTVTAVYVTSGSFAAGTAAGYMHVETASGIWAAENATLTGGGNDMTIAAASMGTYKPGTGVGGNPTENVAAQIIGKTFTAGVTSADVAIGDTKIPLVDYVTEQIYQGDPIKVGTIWTTATECIFDPVTLDVEDAGGTFVPVDFGGVKYVSVEPMTAAVTAGATVTCDQRSYVEYFKGGYRGSQYGLSVDNSVIKHCDLSEVADTGQYAMQLEDNSQVNMYGRMPLSVGRSGLTDATVRIEGADTICTFIGMDIWKNPSVTSHIQLTSTPGRAVFIGCRIEDTASLHPSTEGNVAWDNIRHVGNYTFAGIPVRNGPYTVTPSVQTGGSATGIPISVNASRITEDSSSGVDLTIEVTLGTVSAPTAGSLTIVNSTSDTADWPAPNAAQTGIVDVIANGVGLPASVYCEIGTNKTITLYQQGATGRTALTEANIATGMQFRARLRYTRGAS